MTSLRDELTLFVPTCEQEIHDRALMLAALDAAEAKGSAALEALWGRGDPWHLTASAWVVSRDGCQVLMAYHNLYQSWAWLGGHADGQRDLAAVALREVMEESGLTRVRLGWPHIISCEALTVDGHEKRGKYVSSHLHLNVTYLVEADPAEPVRSKVDENSSVAWMTPEEALARSAEPWFVERVYPKLIKQAATLGWEIPY
ncbi:MAG: NUDIX hydrolase [Coriobacteriales bacterium]|nr:NUDIX hydrolase [Coriobacteriales bacterium]